MTELVTGEAVPLDLRIAGVASRALARLLDLLIQVVVLVIAVLVVSGVLVGGDDALAAAITLVVTVVVLLGYPVAFETLNHGRTPGKLAAGLRVVADDGGPVRFRQALVRGLVGLVELGVFFGITALVVAAVSERGKRIGDLLAGTIVVRSRVPVPSGAQAPDMPAGLGPWAAGLDLSHLGDDLALAARRFLGRVPDMAPGPRRELGHRLADAVLAQVRPGPPAGIPAEVYLAAVLAERRGRELVRLAPPRPAHPYGPGAPLRGPVAPPAAPVAPPRGPAVAAPAAQPDPPPSAAPGGPGAFAPPG